MPRYIDVDALAQQVCVKLCTASNCSNVLKIIHDMPTADVVEVVRCKDCKHGELGINPNDNTECVYCDTLDEVWEVDDFCVMGERREGERNK